MPIDPAVAIGAALPEVTFSWTASDVLLYHLAVGAGSRPGDQTDPKALRWTLDDDNLQVLPSFGIVAPTFHATEPPALRLPGCDISLQKVLHGSQQITLHRPIPTAGTATLRPRIAEVWDKGKAAVIWQEGEVTADTREPLWTVRSSIFARDEGGFGGERGPATGLSYPERAPDAETAYAVPAQQALLYRLCGDRNPLHADPAFAAGAGFEMPILHGLCSYGIVLRELIDLVADGDAARVSGFAARFAGVVYPGETIGVQIWREAEHTLVRAQIVGGDRAGSAVLTDAILRHN